jgi:acetoin utilization deacetylase AcuC-like enzyme
MLAGMSPPRQLFYVDDPRFDAHVAAGHHPECPERLSALRRGLLAPLQSAGAMRIDAREASLEELLEAHDPSHLAGLERALASGASSLDADTYLSAGTRSAAWLAAGAAAQLAEQLWQSEHAAGVLLARPPGHHATRTRAMGFCLLNNIAVAAYRALALGAQRVAIVDWDVHHGNGTQDIFADDPRVLFVSLHQWPLYPGTGQSHEVGRAAGCGSTINLPLPAGSRLDDYAAAFELVVLPALAQFKPELVLVSAGFDAHEEDTLASMQLRDEDFGAMTSSLWSLAERLGAARLGLVLEGGYALSALERAGERVARALLGEGRELPAASASAGVKRAIDATRSALDSYFDF